MGYLLPLCFLADNCIYESYWFQYILFSATLLNYHIVYNSFSVDSLGFSRHTITLSANNNRFTSSLLIIRPLIYFSCLIALVRLSCATMRTKTICWQWWSRKMSKSTSKMTWLSWCPSLRCLPLDLSVHKKNKPLCILVSILWAVNSCNSLTGLNFFLNKKSRSERTYKLVGKVRSSHLSWHKYFPIIRDVICMTFLEILWNFLF